MSGKWTPKSAEPRTRAEETAEYTCGMSAEFVSSVQHIHPDQDYPSLQAVAIYRHGYDLGAAEQRRKDAGLSEVLEAMVERFGHDIFTMPQADRDLLTRAVAVLAKAKGEGA